MSLGLEDLTDDQLVELLQEACVELSVRDPIVRKLAQGYIGDTGKLLPEIRKKIKQVIDSANAKELGEESEDEDEDDIEDPPRWHQRRHRRNPGFHAASNFGSAMPGSFSVPQNPIPSPTPAKNNVQITVPIGVDCRYPDNIFGHLFRAVLGNAYNYLVARTLEERVFIVKLTDDEVKKISAHPLFASFHITPL